MMEDSDAKRRRLKRKRKRKLSDNYISSRAQQELIEEAEEFARTWALKQNPATPGTSHGRSNTNRQSQPGQANVASRLRGSDGFEEQSDKVRDQSGFASAAMSADECDHQGFFRDLEFEEYAVSVDDLVHAARYGLLEDVKTLVTDYGLDVNGYESEQPKRTALVIACIAGHTDVVKFLIEAGADVNQQGHPEAQGFKKISAIHYACRSGNRDIVGLLLSNGASVHDMEQLGETPLHIAAQTGHVDLVDFLLANGATVHDPDKHGNTPLMTAAIYRKYEVVLTLLAKGARVNYHNESNRTPLYMACCGGRNDIVLTLLAHGADVTEYEFSDSSPLYAASKNGHHEVLLTLLAHGAQVRGKDFSKWNPLHAACSESHYSVVTTLLNHGVNVDTYDEKGLTPLHNVCCTWYCRSKDIPHLQMSNKGYTAKILLEYGVDPNILDKGGFTPLERMRDSDWMVCALDKSMLSVMLDYGAGTGVACRVGKCDFKGTILMCFYFFFREMLSEPVPGPRDPGSLMFYEHLMFIRDTYEMYFIKTRAAGLHRGSDEKAVEPPVEGPDWNFSRREAYRAECEAELSRLKTENIGVTSITYFSLLTRDLTALRHQKLLGQLTGDSCARRYPIYGNMIYCSYVRLRRIFLEEESPGFFAIPSPPLLPECAEAVQRYLSEKDLENVVEVYRTYLQYLEKRRKQNSCDL